MEILNSISKDYLKSGELSAFIMETYSRELECYGDNTIECAEELFF
ncbi:MULTISPECIES: lantibiotic dehydratase C-terminal domain-containing protein [Chryseobacterium]